jgi:ribosome-binding ATPase YchF (GTP1/OBG family)
MREELDIPESGLTTVINGAFKLLDLLTFFTVGEAIGQSWHMKKGGTVYDAAGEIHTDIQQGFVRAEVIGYKTLIEAGGYVGARENGTLRVEGRDYVMQDGDVITVKHTN